MADSLKTNRDLCDAQTSKDSYTLKSSHTSQSFYPSQSLKESKNANEVKELYKPSVAGFEFDKNDDRVIVLQWPTDDICVTSENVETCKTPILTSNREIVLDPLVIRGSKFLTRVLEFDPFCSEIDVPLPEQHSMKVAHAVFRFHRQLMNDNKKICKYEDDGDFLNLGEYTKILLDEMAQTPGLLRQCVEFAQVLILEPTYTVLQQWFARILCGLNLKTIEEWITIKRNPFIKGDHKESEEAKNSVPPAIKGSLDTIQNSKNSHTPFVRKRTIPRTPLETQVKLKSCSLSMKKLATAEQQRSETKWDYKNIVLFN